MRNLNLSFFHTISVETNPANNNIEAEKVGFSTGLKSIAIAGIIDKSWILI